MTVARAINLSVCCGFAVILLTLVACGDDDEQSETDEPRRSPTEAPSVEAAVRTPAATPEPNVFPERIRDHYGLSPAEVAVRDCSSSVRGELAEDWRSDSTIIGPLAFTYLPGYADQPAENFESSNGRYLGHKLLIQVDSGASATVVVPEDEKDYVALLYGFSAASTDGGYQLSDGERGVSFVACQEEGAPTQFNGGFLVAGARCSHVEVWVGNATAPERVPISWGAGDRGG